MFCFSNVFVIISLFFFMYLECETYIPARAFSSLRSCDHSVEGAPWKPHGLVMVLGFACGSFASVGREASQEAGQACFGPRLRLRLFRACWARALSGRRAGVLLVPRGGIEPPTRGFSVLCSTD